MKKTALSIFFIFLFFVSFANAEIISSPVNLNIGDMIDAQDFLFDPLLGTLNSVTLEYNPVGGFADYEMLDIYSTTDSGTFSGVFEYNLFFPVTNGLSGYRGFSVWGDIPGEGEYENYRGIMETSGSDTNTFTDPLILSFFTLQANDNQIGLYPDQHINYPFSVSPEVFYDSYGNAYEILYFEPPGGYMTATYDYEPLPEPSTIFLLFVGLIGLTGLKKKLKVY